MNAAATRSRHPRPPIATRAASAPAIAAAITQGARLARNSRPAAPIVLTSEPVHADISWPTILRAGRLSVASPLAQAALGRREGDVLVVSAPRGEMRYTVVAVA